MGVLMVKKPVHLVVKMDIVFEQVKNVLSIGNFERNLLLKKPTDCGKSNRFELWIDGLWLLGMVIDILCWWWRCLFQICMGYILLIISFWVYVDYIIRFILVVGWGIIIVIIIGFKKVLYVCMFVWLVWKGFVPFVHDSN